MYQANLIWKSGADESSAYISDCKKYRYTLRRKVDLLADHNKTLVVCMLNPSTADSFSDDPTIRRVKSFALGFGYTHIIVVNLYAYRATKPEDLWLTDDPIGVENDKFIADAARRYGVVLCAWGANAPLKRQAEVGRMLVPRCIALEQPATAALSIRST